mgnify:FL=1|jgi:hypothetical protein
MRLMFRLRRSSVICSMERCSLCEARGGLGIVRVRFDSWFFDVMKTWAGVLGYVSGPGWSILEISCTDQQLV